MAVSERAPARTHDLVRFDTGPYEAQLPAWVDRVTGEAWAVVTRQILPDKHTAAGLRGRLRSERAAVQIDDRHIVDLISPENLVAKTLHAGFPSVPGDIWRTLDALLTSAPTWFGGRAWGPTGSVGFQLATGLPVVRETSDLDLVIRVDGYLDPEEAQSIQDALATLPTRVDCLLETSVGAVALAEWAATTPDGEVLLRTPTGPSLCRNPWAAGDRVRR
ncbi:hypothetical protein B7R54_01945 [Subtercola boreus]|uniref:Phosphoribosyl-dephospho-CoA transferase MdcG C-terminal domain-containing protein n=1 Tax=Subtercola boreus TaxID=120213 RepID=A0A3E0VEY8_9MICO|nr:malonate decarboxylase holo-ACP synthase [Subtercola boreus]RFA08113.1 hypothetical protein B7R54_01945 [Subtercola boreus]TQL54999.1 phosphoribosyl-dephospho-CoA transferase [Subtercola boreus]